MINLNLKDLKVSYLTFWNPISELSLKRPQFRIDHQLIYLSRDKILISGGKDKSNISLTDNWLLKID